MATSQTNVCKTSEFEEQLIGHKKHFLQEVKGEFTDIGNFQLPLLENLFCKSWQKCNTLKAETMATDDAIAADNKLLFLLHNSNNSEDWKKYNKPRETNTKISTIMLCK